MDGNSADKQYPKLAGQNEAYIARQLTLFKSQKRQNPIMAGFAAALSEQDMHDVGAYFASKASLPGVADEKLIQRGQALYRGGDATLGVPACMACHGPDGRGMAGAGFPQLGGQWADYVQTKLDWKAGTTWGDDTNAKIMPDIAKRLGDQDIAALASYVEACTPRARRLQQRSKRFSRSGGNSAHAFALQAGRIGAGLKGARHSEDSCSSVSLHCCSASPSSRPPPPRKPGKPASTISRSSRRRRRRPATRSRCSKSSRTRAPRAMRSSRS